MTVFLAEERTEDVLLNFNNTIKYKKGYFEDRRPASNMDPYEVTSIIFETTCL